MGSHTDVRPRPLALSASTVQALRKLLIERRQMLCADKEGLEEEACKNGGAASGEGSSVPAHLGDIGSDAFEQDFSLGLAEGRAAVIREIDEALSRIETGSYGICQACNGTIATERLLAIPYAILCVPCKSKEEAA